MRLNRTLKFIFQKISIFKRKNEIFGIYIFLKSHLVMVSDDVDFELAIPVLRLVRLFRALKFYNSYRVLKKKIIFDLGKFCNLQSRKDSTRYNNFC